MKLCQVSWSRQNDVHTELRKRQTRQILHKMKEMLYFNRIFRLGRGVIIIIKWRVVNAAVDPHAPTGKPKFHFL